MNILIVQIVKLSGPLPDEAGHRRWLASLTHRSLEDRLATLRAEAGQPAEHWFSVKTRKNFQPATYA